MTVHGEMEVTSAGSTVKLVSMSSLETAGTLFTVHLHLALLCTKKDAPHPLKWWLSMASFQWADFATFEGTFAFDELQAVSS